MAKATATGSGETAGGDWFSGDMAAEKFETEQILHEGRKASEEVTNQGFVIFAALV